MSAHGPDEIRKHVRVYMVVFATLATLTIVTVGISYLHLDTGAAIALAMAVAIVKGSLVAMFFMHLVSEEKAIYCLLGLTGAFFALLLYLPSGWYDNEVKVDTVWSVLPSEGNAMHNAGHSPPEHAAGHEAEAGHAGH